VAVSSIQVCSYSSRCQYFVAFLGAFAKLRNATISCVTSVSPSVCPRGITRLPLDGLFKMLYLSIFRKAVEKIQVLLKSATNNGYFTWIQICIFDNISLISF